jgi:aarF domain-containing kinase
MKFFLYKTLPEELRIDYAKLWLALLRADKDEIQKISERMNVGQYYGLFACIISMRSWQAVSEGISKSKLSETEV